MTEKKVNSDKFSWSPEDIEIIHPDKSPTKRKKDLDRFKWNPSDITVTKAADVIKNLKK